MYFVTQTAMTEAALSSHK